MGFPSIHKWQRGVTHSPANTDICTQAQIRRRQSSKRSSHIVLNVFLFIQSAAEASISTLRRYATPFFSNTLIVPELLAEQSLAINNNFPDRLRSTRNGAAVMFCQRISPRTENHREPK
jgi:hypothetical protein